MMDDILERTPARATEVPRLDVEYVVGDGVDPKRDFTVAAHLALYWAMQGKKSDAWPRLAVSRWAANLLARGLPLTAEEAAGPGVHWPPSVADLDLTSLPSSIEDLVSGEHVVAWRLEPRSLAVRVSAPKQAYVGHIELTWNDVVRVRQRVAYTKTGRAANVPRSLKTIAAACGLFDGGTRLLPSATVIDDLDDADAFASVVRNLERRQPVMAVTAMAGGEADWMAVVEQHAKKAFALQHVYAVTTRGIDAIREVLGQHGLIPGSLKTYYAGFHDLEVRDLHRLQTSAAIAEHEDGLKGMLERWRLRMAGHEAEERAEQL